MGSLNAWAQTTESAQRGFDLMFNQRAGNCVACHSIPDAAGKKSGLQSSFAPPLDTVAARYDTAALTQWVKDARKINPQTLMPPFGMDLGNGRLLTDAQIVDVVAALSTLKPKQ